MNTSVLASFMHFVFFPPPSIPPSPQTSNKSDLVDSFRLNIGQPKTESCASSYYRFQFSMIARDTDTFRRAKLTLLTHAGPNGPGPPPPLSHPRVDKNLGRRAIHGVLPWPRGPSTPMWSPGRILCAHCFCFCLCFFVLFCFHSNPGIEMAELRPTPLEGI